jgi:hypothetical protein
VPGTHRDGNDCVLEAPRGCWPTLRRAPDGGCEPYEPEAWPWPEGSPTPEARRLFAEGRRLEDQRDLFDAYERYTEAIRDLRHPALILALARCEAGMGRLSAAWLHLRELSKVTPKQGDASAGGHILDAGRAELAALLPRLPRLRVIWPPEATGVRIAIDGQEVSATAVSGDGLVLDPGHYRIVVTAKGHVPVEGTVVAEERAVAGFHAKIWRWH